MADTEPIYKCEKCSKTLDVGGVRWAICEHCERELCTDCGEFGDEDNLCGECRLVQNALANTPRAVCEDGIERPIF